MIELPSRSFVKNESQQMIERADVSRSTFLGSWTRNTTFDAGFLVPFLVDEVLPGDHLSYDVTAYLRMATPLFPIFDGQNIATFFFFVPNRLVWENWVRMMGQQNDPISSINFTVPQCVSNIGGPPSHSIADHFGLPVVTQIDSLATYEVSALPFRAYNLIWNEWFRDQNLQDSLSVSRSDLTDNMVQYNVMRRNKAHDYFTSALPWPQKFTAPNIPLAGILPVSGLGSATGTYAATASVFQPGGISGSFLGQTASNFFIRGGSTGPGAFPDVFVSLANSAGIPLNTLRQSWMIQSLLERDARGGTRYTEIIQSHFGVNNPDSRLQRPEYIGGGSAPLSVTPVAQTSPTAGLNVGSLGAAATSVGRHAASYAATEHGFIIGLINVQSELSYHQGVSKQWDRRTRYDFYWPSLAHLGEQAVTNREIYATGVAGPDSTVFGYQERWHEYRSHVSEVTGQFRPGVVGTLDPWLLSQRFLSAPVLGAAFIREEPPMARILAAGAAANNQQYLANILISRKATRAIPMFSTPSSMGRF